jgi:hypothetical protein
LGAALTTALLLPFRFVVALPLITGELHDFNDGDWEDLKARGLQVINLNPSQTERAFALMGWLPRLSAYDCFSLSLAETTENAMLLTGDQQLRSAAAILGVEVHGVLWISDEIERSSEDVFR